MTLQSNNHTVYGVIATLQCHILHHIFLQGRAKVSGKVLHDLASPILLSLGIPGPVVATEDINIEVTHIVELLMLHPTGSAFL